MKYVFIEKLMQIKWYKSTFIIIATIWYLQLYGASVWLDTGRLRFCLCKKMNEHFALAFLSL